MEFAQKNLSHFGKKPAYTDRVEVSLPFANNLLSL